MKCAKCNSSRVANISAKCSDLCFVSIGDNESDGYVPHDMNIGGGDYVEIDICLDCGHVNGSWPVPVTSLESAKINEDEE